MAKDIPTVSHAVLYDSNPTVPVIRLDTPQWFSWLDIPSNIRFSYALHNRAEGYIDGFMTIRKETRQRGGSYWSAYRRRNGTLRKIYIGQSAAVTLGRLEECAIRLRDPPASSEKVTQHPQTSRKNMGLTADISTSNNGHF